MASEVEKQDGIVETIKTIVYALLIAGVFRSLFFQPFWIPSSSMKDTLLVGDFLFVNKMAYGYAAVSCPFSMCPITGRILGKEPVLGDVVVFRHPARNEDFIKRLMGMPGDKVQLKDGVVFINGVEAVQEPVGTFEEVLELQGPARSRPSCNNNVSVMGEICTKERFTETLPNGVSHSILNIRDSSVDNTPIYTVPAGHYLFMGDNRDNSTDGRFPVNRNGVGYVPFENLIGRADRIMFSSAGRSMLFFWTWRSDRFFKAVN